MPNPQATREFVRILRLHEDYPEGLIAQALEQALAAHCHSVDGVKQLLRRLVEPGPPPPLDQKTLAHLAMGPVVWPDVAQFDRLLAGIRGGGR